MPRSWFAALALALMFRKVEETGVWPGELSDAYIVMIQRTDGDVTHLDQRPLSILAMAHRLWGLRQVVPYSELG